MDEDKPQTFSNVVSATNRNLSRLTRNVALTASVVMAGHEQASLSAPSAYHRAMSEVATYQRRLFASKIKENTPRQAIRQSLAAKLGGMRAPQVESELLLNLPPSRTAHSLFQTFEVTAPVNCVPSNLKFGAQSESNLASSTYALSVRKEMAASELVDIDERISELRLMRKIVFQRMADAERIQSSAEPSLQHFYPAGEKIKDFTLSQGTSVAFIDFNLPFGQLALASDDFVELHGLNTESCVRLRGTEGHSITALVVQGSDPVVTCGAGNNLFMWSNQSPEPSVLEGHISTISSVSHDGESLVSSSSDKTVRHWDDKLGRCITTIDSFKYGTCLALQHLSSALATGFEDGIVRLWDLRTNTAGPQRELRGGHTQAVTALHFTGFELASGSQDGSVRIWDLRNGEISHVEAYSGHVRSLSFDTTKFIASIAGEHGVRVLSRTTREHRISAMEGSAITAARYMKGYLVTGRETGEVGVYAV